MEQKQKKNLTMLNIQIETTETGEVREKLINLIKDNLTNIINYHIEANKANNTDTEIILEHISFSDLDKISEKENKFLEEFFKLKKEFEERVNILSQQYEIAKLLENNNDLERIELKEK